MKTIHKLLIIFSICLTLLVYECQAQEVKIEKKEPFIYKTEQECIKNSVKTSKFVVLKGIQHILYQGNRGGLFYITVSKNGLYRKNYIKTQN